MNQSPKLLIVVGSFCVLLIIGLSWVRVKEPQETPNQMLNHSKPVFDVASGDTNNEVLHTLIANQQQLQRENKKLAEQNAKLQVERNQDLQESIEKTSNTLNEKLAHTKTALESKLTGQQQTIQILENKLSHAPIRVDKSGFELNDSNDNNNDSQIIKAVPDLKQTLSAGLPGASLENATVNNSDNNPSDEAPSLPSDNLSNRQKLKPSTSTLQDIIPYYTIPANATLNHVALMSAIIAEVPVGGHLVAPAFPFKAIIGKEDLLSANGISLPAEIAGIVMEGYSIGNMTLSCARAYVQRVLFVFNDGHFVVYPEKSAVNATDIYPKETLGYLSDVYGNTCVTGTAITDAPKVIANLAMLGGVATAGSALSQAQLSTMSDEMKSSTALTGSMAKYIGGATLNGVSSKALEWYSTRVADIFDAVYIPASKNHRPIHLVFNVTQTIPIDLNKKGRTINHENAMHGSSMAHRFD